MWPSLVRTLGLCLRPLLLMVSSPGGGCGEAYVCVNLHFGAQLMHRKETESSEFLFGLCASTQAWFPESLGGLLPLFPNPFFHVSLTSAQPRSLRSVCWWQRYCELRATTEDHTARERRRGH